MSVNANLTSTATTGSTEICYVHIETPEERMRRYSNEAAEYAMRFGLQGYDTTAGAFAHIAELYALLAEHIRLGQAIVDGGVSV